MTTRSTTLSYKGFRFPQEIIAHAVWFYFRFNLSYRDVEELLAARGVIVTYETVRQWCLKFGQTYANELRRRRARPGDKWHLDLVAQVDSLLECRIRRKEVDPQVERLGAFALTCRLLPT